MAYKTFGLFNAKAIIVGERQWYYLNYDRVHIVLNWPIGHVGRVFANGQGDRGSIPGRFIPKTQKMVLDSSFLNTQHYKVSIKVKVKQSREKSSAFPYTSV